jgi:hypothetical protein
MQIEGGNATTSTTMQPDNYIPDMICTDFLLGVLNTFNAVIYYNKPTKKFIIQHRTDWYLEGKTLDLTDYLDTSKRTVLPPPLFKVYDMRFEEGLDYLNLQYIEEQQNRPWGGDRYDTGYKNGQVYEFNNPFTATYWQEVVTVGSDDEVTHFGSQVPSLQAVNPEGDAIQPNVRLMWYNGLKVLPTNESFTTNDGTNPSGLSFNVINDFSNILNDDGSGQALQMSYRTEPSWDLKSASEYEDGPLNNLYSKFFNSWVGSVYNIRTRRYLVTMWLPQHKIKEIEMNDTIVLNQKEYHINEMKVNFISGRVDFELIDKMNLQPANNDELAPIYALQTTTTGYLPLPFAGIEDSLIVMEMIFDNASNEQQFLAIGNGGAPNTTINVTANTTLNGTAQWSVSRRVDNDSPPITDSHTLIVNNVPIVVGKIYKVEIFTDSVGSPIRFVVNGQSGVPTTGPVSRLVNSLDFVNTGSSAMTRTTDGQFPTTGKLIRFILNGSEYNYANSWNGQTPQGDATEVVSTDFGKTWNPA